MADLALDLGQSGARVRLIADDGRRADVELDGFRYGSDIAETVRDRFLRGAAQLGVGRVRAVAAGLTGLYGVAPEFDAVARALHRELGVERVVIADDAVTSHLGGFGGGQGALVAAGTGIVGLAIGPAGAARVDGNGAMIGDDGSGWWIGRRGIIAALSARDGRSGASPLLLRSLERQYGPAPAVPMVIRDAASPVGLVARFAPAVADAAREGDGVAGAIWSEAAAHIGDAVVACAARAGFERDDGFPWAVTGSLTGAADLLDPVLHRVISARFPRAARADSAGTGLDGADRLLDHPDPRSLAPLVSVSTAQRDSDD